MQMIVAWTEKNTLLELWITEIMTVSINLLYSVHQITLKIFQRQLNKTWNILKSDNKKYSKLKKGTILFIIMQHILSLKEIKNCLSI